jgi:hypothetical protein
MVLAIRLVSSTVFADTTGFSDDSRNGPRAKKNISTRSSFKLLREGV